MRRRRSRGGRGVRCRARPGRALCRYLHKPDPSPAHLHPEASRRCWGDWKERTLASMCASRRDGQRDGFEALLAAAAISASRSRLAAWKSVPAASSVIQLAASSWRVLVVAQVGLLAGVGVLDDVPAVAGEVVRWMMSAPMAPWRAALFELVGPAAVVGERLAAEEFGVVGRRVANDAETTLPLTSTLA